METGAASPDGWRDLGNFAPKQTSKSSDAKRCRAITLHRSMRSIKRDVKAKVLPRPEPRYSREIQPIITKLPWSGVTCGHSNKPPLVS